MKTAIFTIALIASSAANAWSGYSYDTSNYIEVETYDHQGIGEGEVEYYDYESGDYKYGYLDMYPGGTGTITDNDSGESFDVDMD